MDFLLFFFGESVSLVGAEYVEDAILAPTQSTENTDAKDFLRTGVVGDLESRLLLDHQFLLVVEPVLNASRAVSLAELSVGLSGPVRRRGGKYYFAFSRIWTTRQRLVADSGRVSMMRTRSPMPQAFCSSCALSLLVRRMTLP